MHTDLLILLQNLVILILSLSLSLSLWCMNHMDAFYNSFFFFIMAIIVV